MRRRLTLAFALGLPLVAAPLAAGAPADSTGAPADPANSSSAAAAPSASAPSTKPTVASTTPAPAPAADVGTKSGETGMNGATYAVRLRDLEQRVDELKDQVRRSHTRLALLSDTIMSNGIAGSRAEIRFENEMSSAFQLVRALFVMDGQIQYSRQDDSGALADQKNIPIYQGSVPPGDHTLQVALTFQGNGYGVFSYLRGYKFEVKSSHAFTAIEGKSVVVSATAYEKGGVTTPLEQRPTIDWHEKVSALGPGSGSSSNGPVSASGGGAK
jgi:hypothetical protein